MATEGKVRPGCPNASNPYHVCGNHCSGAGSKLPSPGLVNKLSNPVAHQPKERVRNGEIRADAGKKKMEEGRRHVNPSCVNASNPYHVCVAYCFEKMADTAIYKPTMREQSNAHVTVGENKKIDHKCPNSSNAYHECTESCLKKIQEQGRGTGGKVGSIFAAGGSKEHVGTTEKRDVHSNCVKASNPYHKCGEYCHQGIQEPDKARGGRSPTAAGGSNEVLKVAERKDVHPNCINASNPYHKCAEYCFQRINRTV